MRPRRLVPPGPDATALDSIAAAGLRGIDHGALRPWRLLLVEDRELLATAFAAAERWLRPEADAQRLERAREKAQAGPVILALIARPVPDRPEVPEHEQWIAVGAAAQQMLLAADALGFAGSLLSGRKTEAPPLRAALGLDADERLVGFLTLGTPAEPTATKRPAPDPRRQWSSWP
ncbi:MAG: nitroreductase family protein [Alphaproteobacteria bacterium]|nr:nitroreductase family protein [Alphaproteobacteria bacterium]